MFRVRISPWLMVNLMISSIWFPGCQKEETTGEIQGNLSLALQIKHHSWGVPYTDVYLKSNCTVFPGKDTLAYDFHLQTDNDGFVEFLRLHPGNYFVYSSGYDMIWGDTVIGYCPVTLPISSGNTRILYVSE